MEFRITIDIFSGRKNPVLDIRGREATQLYERLRPARRLSGPEMGPAPLSTLGYRGLIIEQSGARGLPRTFRITGGDLLGPKLAHRASYEDVERFLARNKTLMRKLRMGER